MSTYNPHAGSVRHRRAKVRQEMTAGDFLRCMGITIVTVLAFFTAALI